MAYLEKIRTDRYDACATVLQKNIRRYVYRHRYVRMRDLAIKLQCLARKKSAEKKLLVLRQEKAAIVLQKNFRRFIVRKEYLAKKDFVVKLQAGKLYI